LEAIGARVAAAGKRVLHEYAESVKNAYAFAVEELRERAAQLIALHRLSGSHGGRVCFDIPNLNLRRFGSRGACSVGKFDGDMAQQSICRTETRIPAP
jgi:hypothetical protein